MTTVYINICTQDNPKAPSAGPLLAIGALKLRSAEPSLPLSTEDPMVRYASDLAYNIAEPRPAFYLGTCHISISMPRKISFHASCVWQLQTEPECRFGPFASAGMRLNASHSHSLAPASRRPAKLELGYAPLNSSKRMLEPSSRRDNYHWMRYLHVGDLPDILQPTQSRLGSKWPLSATKGNGAMCPIQIYKLGLFLKQPQYHLELLQR